MTTFFLELRVWKRQDAATAILYRCFKNMVTGRFAVQSADFFKLPIDANQLRNSEMQFVELFIDAAPSERCDWFDTAEEAIAAHDCDFS
jgi:hypothetical protein